MVVESKFAELADYSGEHFKIDIIREGVKTYAVINAEMYFDDDGLAPTGKYFVYLLHPRLGSKHFEVEPGTNADWVITPYNNMIDEFYYKAVTNAIESKNE